MDRRSPCAVFREHRRSAPREALDPGEGEAMLGQALHDRSLRFFEHTVPLWELSLPRGAGWASTSFH